MNRRVVLAGLSLLAFAASGCGGVTRQDVDATLGQASDMYAELVLGKDDLLIARFPAELQTTINADLLAKMRAAIPLGPGKPAVLVGQHVVSSPKGDSVQLIRRYDYRGGGIVFSTSFARASADAAWKSVGMYLDSPATKEALDAMSLGVAKEPPPERVG